MPAKSSLLIKAGRITRIISSVFLYAFGILFFLAASMIVLSSPNDWRLATGHITNAIVLFLLAVFTTMKIRMMMITVSVILAAGFVYAIISGVSFLTCAAIAVSSLIFAINSVKEN